MRQTNPVNGSMPLISGQTAHHMSNHGSQVTTQVAGTQEFLWVIVLTVWHRETLEMQLSMLKAQRFTPEEKASGRPMKVCAHYSYI
jgi:hypothetical protein